MPDQPRATITLLIDPEAYASEAEKPLTREVLEEQGRYVNEDAAGMLGYEGWQTKMPGEEDRPASIRLTLKQMIALGKLAESGKLHGPDDGEHPDDPYQVIQDTTGELRLREIERDFYINASGVNPYHNEDFTKLD